jgi:hypothetical protein
MYGCGEWRVLIEMTCRVRAQRKSAHDDSRATPV